MNYQYAKLNKSFVGCGTQYFKSNITPWGKILLVEPVRVLVNHKSFNVQSVLCIQLFTNVVERNERMASLDSRQTPK